MRTTINKTELINFSRPGHIDECLSDLEDISGDYKIINVAYNQSLHSGDTIELILESTKPYRLFEASGSKHLILTEFIWDLPELDQYLRSEPNKSIRPIPGIAGNLTVQIDKSMLSWWNDMFPKQIIESIQYNETKRITTVVFTDGDVQMAKLGKGDEYDPCVGVAICIAAHEFKSKTAFKKFVEKNIKVVKPHEKK